MNAGGPPTDGEVRSFCRICVASCGILVSVRGGEATRIRGDRDHPISHGYTCEKGRARLEHRLGPNRLLRTRLGRGEASRAVPAAELLEDLARQVGAIAESSGPDAIATYAVVARASTRVAGSLSVV